MDRIRTFLLREACGNQSREKFSKLLSLDEILFLSGILHRTRVGVQPHKRGLFHLQQASYGSEFGVLQGMLSSFNFLKRTLCQSCLSLEFSNIAGFCNSLQNAKGLNGFSQASHLLRSLFRSLQCYYNAEGTPAVYPKRDLDVSIP